MHDAIPSKQHTTGRGIGVKTAMASRDFAATNMLTMPEKIAARWLAEGDTALARMREMILGATESVRLEIYIYRASEPGDGIREALAEVAGRGVQVKVLVDGFGSTGLGADYWTSVTAAGGEVRIFNPLSLDRIAIRDHRKLLVVDDRLAIVGGFNVAPEYLGDGVTRGWRDIGLEVEGEVAGILAGTFDVMFENHLLRHRRLVRLQRIQLRHLVRPPWRNVVLATGPGLGYNLYHYRLLRDLAHARRIEIIAAYFVPGFRIRRALRRAARRGAQVQLILAGKSDVPLVQYAGRCFYLNLLRAGVRIAEYQPQILHAKLAIVDDVVYVGSANLDVRSFGINYELVLRLQDPELAAEGRRIFADARAHSAAVEYQAWKESRTWWNRTRERWARFLFTRLDVWLAHRQLRRLT